MIPSKDIQTGHELMDRSLKTGWLQLIIGEIIFLLPQFQRSSIRISILTSDRNQRNRPENGGIPRWKNQVTVYSVRRDGRQEDMIVDTWPKKVIKEEGSQAELGEQRHEALSRVTMSPTSSDSHRILEIDDYG